MEAKRRKALAPRPKPLVAVASPKGPAEETLYDSVVNSIMHNNLFYVMLVGMIGLSFCIFSLRLIRGMFYFV